jgi:hypothetical protein
MKALFINHQKAYFQRVKERDYNLPQTEGDSINEIEDDRSSSSGRSWTYETSLENNEENFILKNIQSASQPIRPRSAAVRGHLSVAPLTPLSKVPSFFYGRYVVKSSLAGNPGGKTHSFHGEPTSQRRLSAPRSIQPQVL